MKQFRLLFLGVIMLTLGASCVPVPPLTEVESPTPAKTASVVPQVVPTATAEPLRAPAVPNSVLVRYAASAPAAARAQARAVANGKADKAYKIVPGLEKLTVVDAAAAVQTLKRLPGVMYAEPDYIVTIDEPRVASAGVATAISPDTFPNDPRLAELWGLANIEAPWAWDITTGMANMVVAVIDTGIDFTHPDLAANIWTNPREIPDNRLDDDGNGFVDDVHGYDFANNDGNPLDDHFHGTHVAGTIGAIGDNGAGVVGVNWQVKLMPVKFLSAYGSGSVSAAISALEYAVAMNARLSNNSWSGGGYSQALYDAIQASQAAGHLFVAAAGNSAANADLSPSYPAAFNLDNIVSVAAIDSANQLASFSNYGVNAVDLAAPGVQILSTMLGGGFASYSGTSMAAPHVTGTAALVYSLHPDWSYAQVRDQILATTVALPALSGRTLTGGAVNAGEALNNAAPGPVPTPAPPPPPPPPPPYYSFALAEFTLEGRSRGSSQDTWYNDDVVESITERSTSGSPSTRTDRLEHIWQYYVPTGRSLIVLRIDAWAPVSRDNDKMLFAYSLDRSNWTPMFSLTQTAHTNTYQEYVLPAEVGGHEVYVRVQDSDRMIGSWKTADTVYVDQMIILSSVQ